jgi:undecaprenyl-diphosphatase
MSNAGTDGTDAPKTPAEAVEAVKAEARFGAAFLRINGGRLLLVFVGLLLPLWGFSELSGEIREGEAFAFDKPGLLLAHAMASAGLDRLFVVVSALGYEYGVVPFDVLLVLGLALRRRYREGLFAGLALAGSGLLNVAAKQAFSRERPSLWESIAPETTYSFPSGHAMGSMTLACVVVLLCWPTRWRWPVAVAATAFAILVGLSRIYLGVHYPSDIVAGWLVAMAWTVGVYGLVFAGTSSPWRAQFGTTRRPG